MFTQVFFSASHWETETDYSNIAACLPPFPNWAKLSFDSLQGKRVKPLPTTTASTEYSLHRQIAAAHCMSAGCSQKCVRNALWKIHVFHFRGLHLTKNCSFLPRKFPSLTLLLRDKVVHVCSSNQREQWCVCVQKHVRCTTVQNHSNENLSRKDAGGN